MHPALLPQVRGSPVGGRLQNFRQGWERISKDPWVLNLVGEGLLLPFQDDPPLLSNVPINLTSHHTALEEIVTKLADKQAIERVVVTSSPGFYSRLFLVPKKDGTWRPVIDLSALNTFLRVDRFKMETAASVRLAIRQGDWAVSIDLSDAYFHILVRPPSRKYLRFMALGQVWQFRALPFGLAIAPRVFSKLMVVVAAHLRSVGIRIVQYLDDWLVLHSSRQLLLDQLSFALELMTQLGLVVNEAKSELSPSQEFVFIGMHFYTPISTVFLPVDRGISLRSLVTTVLHSRQVPARLFLSLLGTLNAASELIPLGRLQLRPLQFFLNEVWSPRRDSLELPLTITEEVRSLLRPWLDSHWLAQGNPICPPVAKLFLFTDASLSGWGAHLEPAGLLASGTWPQGHKSHINNLELRAVRLALESFQDLVQGSAVMVASDNSTVVSYIRRQGGTRSRLLFRETESLLLWCASLGISLQAKHIAGRLNVLADRLSRQDVALPGEWSLSQRVANSLFDMLGLPLLDLFASSLNNKLPRFVSLVPENKAFARDAMSLSWDNLFGYAFPPFILIGAVLHKLRLSSGRLILIAPCWPQRAWFADLLLALYDYPVAIPTSSDVISQCEGRVLHHNLPMLHLHAWPLSGILSENITFRNGLPHSLPHLDDNPPELSMTPSGESMRIGALEGKSILVRHLSQS